MNAYTSREELALLPANRVSYPEHYADARSLKPGLYSRVVEWFHRQAAMNELSQLSDRELADIGLGRSDLPHVFDPAFAARRGR
jgi:uncharacterized protein YjiS (DUF1127 family)